MALITGMINGAGPQQKNMSRQIDPNLALLLQAAGKGGGRYDLSGNPIMPGQGQPSGLDAFYAMQDRRAQQLGGLSQSRMFARDMMAQEQEAMSRGGFMKPAVNPNVTPDQSLGPNVTPPPVVDTRPYTQLPPDRLGGGVAQDMYNEERQRAAQRGAYDKPSFGSGMLDPNSIAGRYFAGASPREMEGLYAQQDPNNSYNYRRNIAASMLAGREQAAADAATNAQVPPSMRTYAPGQRPPRRKILGLF